ncbi:MAG TPA: lamin tail domain-containing protein [Candidatus Paceibacterota bacterium]|nr:lamin tail domain-containing protein [Candidatus Paceibacterota bacterium]
MRIHFLAVVMFSISALPGTSLAAITINEIMYDLEGTDTGREWIEIYNSGDGSVDLSGWKLLESGVRHSLTIQQGNTSIPANGYAVIADNTAKFSADWPEYGGILFDSAFALSNEGEAIELFNSAGSSVDTASYAKDDGGLGDGNSLQQKGASWIAAAPTPGASNATAARTVEEGTNDEAEDDDTDEDDKKSDSVSQFTVSLGNKRSVMAGTPALFQSKVTPKSVAGALYYDWSFGDGTTGRDKKETTHVYEFPGAYLADLTVRSREASAHDQVEVSVVEAEVEITDIGFGLRPYIELTNNSSIDANLSNWRLMADKASFIFPSGTWLKAGSSIKFPSSFTKLAPTEKSMIVLYLPSGYPVNSRISRAPLPLAEADTIKPLAVALPSAAASKKAQAIEELPLASASTSKPEAETQVAAVAASAIELERPSGFFRSAIKFLYEIFH